MTADRGRFGLWVSLLFLLAGFSLPAAAAQGVEVQATAAATLSDRFSAELYGGFLKGQSRELVYDANTGAKVSELIWSIDRAYVIGGALAARPFERLKISVGGWTPISSSNSMDDYDWLRAGFNDWSDWSSSPDTKLHNAYQIDARAAFTLASLDRKPAVADPWRIRRASLDLIGGYRWSKLSWTGYGGTYIYSRGGGLRNSIGAEPKGEAGISYEQWWEVPYLGLGGSLGIDRWTLTAEVIGSLWVKARDRDYHHLRAILFEDSYSRSSMIALNAALAYELIRNVSLFARFDYEKYNEAKGETTLTNFDTGKVSTFSGDAAGADFRNTITSLGLRVSF